MSDVTVVPCDDAAEPVRLGACLLVPSTPGSDISGHAGYCWQRNVTAPDDWMLPPL